jgi:hypothetical protein
MSKEVVMWWNRLKDRQQLGLILVLIAAVLAIVASLLKSEELMGVAATLVMVGVVMSL